MFSIAYIRLVFSNNFIFIASVCIIGKETRGLTSRYKVSAFSSLYTEYMEMILSSAFISLNFLTVPLTFLIRAV